MPRGGKVEQFNQHFQRNFYRLMRLKRGSFAQIELQAEEITNNLVSKYTKLSPADAVQSPTARSRQSSTRAGSRASATRARSRRSGTSAASW